MGPRLVRVKWVLRLKVMLSPYKQPQKFTKRLYSGTKRNVSNVNAPITKLVTDAVYDDWLRAG